MNFAELTPQHFLYNLQVRLTDEVATVCSVYLLNRLMVLVVVLFSLSLFHAPF